MDDEIIEVEEDIIKDFLDEFIDAYEELERTLVLLDTSPSDKELVNQLFRIVHSIKSNLRMVALDKLSEVVHVFENILDDIRNNRLNYTQSFNDIILLVIAKIRELAIELFHDNNVDEQLTPLNEAVQMLSMTEPDQFHQTIVKVLQTIDPQGEYDAIDDTTITDDINTAFSNTSENTDLDYFLELSQQIENSFPFWKGRTLRILDLSLRINEQAGHPIDPQQLTAAVYIHDIGMAFLPPGIHTKSGKLDADEILILQNHCHLGSEWLRRIPGWEAAADMVHQHHERPDGQGYPQGLSTDEICDGAKILNIADTFEAMTQNRVHRENKRPMMRALLEINSHINSQFDGHWVEAFNQVIKAQVTTNTKNKN